jgi:hypothetical protein
MNALLLAIQHHPFLSVIGMVWLVTVILGLGFVNGADDDLPEDDEHG